MRATCLSTSQSLHKHEHEILVFDGLHIYIYKKCKKSTKETCTSKNCCQDPWLLSCSDCPDCGLLIAYFPPKCLEAVQYLSYRLAIIVV